MEDNTKRRSSELEEHGVSPRPPLKKRFLSTSSPSPSPPSSPTSHSADEEEEEEDAAAVFKEPLEAFQKDAILRQWKDYNRTSMRLKKQLDPLERLKKETDDSTPVWQDAYTRVESSIHGILNEKLRLPSTSTTASAPNTNNTNSNNTTSTESTIQTLLDNQAFSDNQLINVQQTLDQRLKEIEAIKNDRIIIKQQIARLEMDWISMPESRIYKTPMCRNLYNARTNLKEKCNHLYNSCHDIQNKLDDILDQRRMLIKQWNSDKTSRMKGLEGNLKKLDMELTLVRSERDSFQSDLDELKASSSSVGNASFLEWKVISDTRDDLAHYLETELLRLQRKMAAKTGDKLYYDLYLKADPQHSIITILEKDTRQLREKVDQTRHRLANHPQINELDTVSHFIRLDKEATCFEEEHGFHPSVSDEQHAIQILQDRIEQEKEFISQEQHKVTALEPIIQQLLEEIEKVIQLYPELEEQCVTKVQELASAEDEIKQLQLERVKYNQTFTFLNKSKDALTMVGNALNKQIEKQLTHIKDMNEREKNLTSQATCLDRELNTSNAVYDIYKQKNDESKATLKELEERSQAAKDKISELQKTIMDKIQLSLLNCTICKTRLKSHALIRCMHTYCKECLDDLIRKNARVCPHCSEPFSPSDVRQFF
ncbi:hypothetical protein K501DRAFT_289492 [Backusella circina FSU 941]|nr:hypothetical protein K501DRAFT_289492 [Backusella circina FSU 941]